MTKSQLNFLTKIFLFSILAKVVLAIFIPVVGDESYYWIWGQNLQLSYFDHPAVVAWLTWFSNILSPILGSLGLRLPFIILSSLTFIFWYKSYLLYQQDFSSPTAFAALYFLNPLLGLGGIFATPDVPLMFFWTLAFWSTLKIINTQHLKWYALLGVSLGLGFCSKYHIVLFPLSLVISLGLIQELKIIQFKKLSLTFLLGLIFSLPVLLWNNQNDWVSFKFQLNHGLNDHKPFNIIWPIGYLLAQIALFNPFVLYYLLKKVRASLPKNMALVQWGFFLFSSFKALVEANWPLGAQAQGLAVVNKSFHPYFKRSLLYYLFLWLILVILFFTPFGLKKLNKLPQSIAAAEIYSLTQEFRPLYGPTYQMSSLLHFVSGEKIYKLKSLARFDFYDTLEDSTPQEKVFYVLKYTFTDWPEWLQDYNLEIVKTISKYDLELYRVTHE